MWRVMMAELAPSSSGGDYTRPMNALPRAARLSSQSTLFVGLACPWCHRALLARALALPSDDVRIDVVQVFPGRDGLWALRPEDHEAWDATRLREIYARAAPEYGGRATAPLLVGGSRADAEASRRPTVRTPNPENEGVVANDSADILALIAEAGSAAPIWYGKQDDPARVAVWLRPPEGNEFGIDPSILENLCLRIYEHVNNGVYKSGFATTQAAYERAENSLFQELDRIEATLAGSRFLMSPEVVTEADIRLFPTAFRLDAVYGPLFRASRKVIALDYPAIASWLRDIYALPGVRETCDLRATHDNYYSSLFPLNPGGIVPVPRESDLTLPHNRTGLGVHIGH
jgi:glutathionyl-hydroquinone reductase